ncbi:hypothetical protein NMY22_g8235 [Coprinellus aureogranulatus]|nr:hypothetical protein NMY22_g8235 [Coprinellus aureogranulatus]
MNRGLPPEYTVTAETAPSGEGRDTLEMENEQLKGRLSYLERMNTSITDEKKELTKLLRHWTDKYGHLQDRLLIELERRRGLENEVSLLKMKLDQKRFENTELARRILEAGRQLALSNTPGPSTPATSDSEGDE